ncbi:hypothetical protein DFH28DRAFT_1083808 [Melampsora americana]|nr:hypothetical protein DFH28DRAFT_1083808 [Melampsora americana]
MINALPSFLKFSGSSTSQSNLDHDAGRDEDGGDHDNTSHSMEVDFQRETDSLPNFDQESPSDDITQTCFQTAQPGYPSMNLPMAPAAQAQWTDALRIGSITGSENQYHALVCLLQKTHQDMDNVMSQLCPAVGWKPASDLGAIYFGTTLTDLNKHKASMKFFGARIRHIWDDFRAALLTNILVPQSKVSKPRQPVPKLSELQLLASQLPSLSHIYLCIKKGTNASLDSKAQAQFSYPRTEAVEYHYASKDERKVRPSQSHWAWVDQQLSKRWGENRNETRASCQAFDTIVLASNQDFLDGKKTIDKMKANEKLRVPTDTDISKVIDFMLSNTN